MTISNNPGFNDYACNGVTTAFPVTFKFFADDELRAFVRNKTTGVQTDLVLDTDYTVSGAGNGSGGTVTSTAVWSSDYTFHIRDRQPIEQQTDLRNLSRYSPETVETEFDRLAIMVRQHEKTLGRCIKVADGDVSGASVDLEYPDGGLESKNLTFDANGNVSASAPVDGAVAVSAAMEPVVGAATKALGRVALGPWDDISVGVLNLKSYGLVEGGAVETAVALAMADVTSNDAVILIPPGNYISNNVINFVRPVTVIGYGATITAQSANNMFQFSNFSGTEVNGGGGKVYGINFVGANLSLGGGDGGAVSFSTSGTTTRSSQIVVKDCSFSNFKGDYWVYIVGASTDYDYDSVIIEGNSFKSMPGNARDGTSLAVPTTAISIQGSSSGGVVRNIVINGNTFEWAYSKTCVALLQGSRDAVVSNNVIKNVGTDASIQNDKGAYAFMVYDSSFLNVPYNITFSNNVVRIVKSCGFYLAGAKRLTLIGNTIDGQTDTTAGSLPKGGIVLNGCTEVIVSGNTVRDSASSAIYTINDGTYYSRRDVSIIGNRIFSCGDQGVRIVCGYMADENVVVSGNTIDDCTNEAISAQTVSPGVLSGLVIKNNVIKNSAYGVRAFSGDASNAFDDMTISGNTISGCGYGIFAESITSYRVTISDNTLYGDFANRGIDIASSLKVTCTFNRFIDVSGSSAACFYTTDTRGVLFGNTFSNCNSGKIFVASGNALGSTAPWYTGVYNEKIQNLNASELGSGGSKYIIDGWVYLTAWLEQRTLTGN